MQFRKVPLFFQKFVMDYYEHTLRYERFYCWNPEFIYMDYDEHTLR